MRAAVYARLGDVDVITIEDVAGPICGNDDVVIDVACAGLNRADILERRGLYGPPERTGAPLIPGLEYAGTVADVGADVSALRRGDRVFGIAPGRAHGQQIAVNAATAMRIPHNVGFEEAAAIPEAFITAWDALLNAGGFRLGMTAVVHAAGSGVGLAALSLARAGGGTTIGTSRSRDKLERASAHGMDYGALLDEDWPAVALRVTQGRGVDVVLDFVGPATFDRNVASLRTGGRIVQIGTLGGAAGAVSFRDLMAKRASLLGTVLRARPLHERVALARKFESEVVPLFARGVLRPVIDRVFALDEIRDAHRYMEENRNFGKIVLRIGNVMGPR